MGCRVGDRSARSSAGKGNRSDNPMRACSTTERRVEGAPLLTAATEGARLRFRPVMMTSIAFIPGLLPLVIAEGPSRLARRDVGSPVFGGMLSASFIEIFAIPASWLWLQSSSTTLCIATSRSNRTSMRIERSLMKGQFANGWRQGTPTHWHIACSSWIEPP